MFFVTDPMKLNEIDLSLEALLLSSACPRIPGGNIGVRTYMRVGSGA